MTDIERKLRDLGERTRDDQAPIRLNRQALRRIRTRRFALAAIGSAAIVTLVAGSTMAFTSLFDGSRKLAPAGQAELLITYERDEGFAGRVQHLEVRADGSAVLRDRSAVLRKNALTTQTRLSFKVSATDLDRLEAEIDVIEWSALQPAYALNVGVVALDGLTHVVTHAGIAIQIEDPAIPTELKDLIVVLEQILQFSPSTDPVLGCGPPVDFEPTYLPDGWVPELQGGAALGNDTFGNIVGHYSAEGDGGRKMHAGFIDLVAFSFPFDPPRDGDVIVLGQPAEHDEANGTIEFGIDGCAYALVGGGVGREELVPFAEGLRTTAEGEDEPRPAPSFKPRAGWDTLTMATGTWPRNQVPSAFAATFSLDKGSFPDFPRDQLTAMGDDHVLVIVMLWNSDNYPSEPSDNFPEGDGTFDISDATVTHSWEGQVEDVPLYDLRRTVDGRQVQVWTFFGTSSPSDALLEKAQQALDDIVLP